MCQGICVGGERSGNRDVARRSRGRSCLVALRDGRRDNNHATFDSFPLLYIGGCVTVIGEAGVAACRYCSSAVNSSCNAMIYRDNDDGHLLSYRFRVP